jgi:2-succinyl-5-enolpyruvyl-6-hydroxy-3-cyclohexene-1-carboxylate synthase
MKIYFHICTQHIKYYNKQNSFVGVAKLFLTRRLLRYKGGLFITFPKSVSELSIDCVTKGAESLKNRGRSQIDGVGQVAVGQVAVDQVAVGQVAVGQVAVGQVTRTRLMMKD